MLLRFKCRPTRFKLLCSNSLAAPRVREGGGIDSRLEARDADEVGRGAGMGGGREDVDRIAAEAGTFLVVVGNEDADERI